MAAVVFCSVIYGVLSLIQLPAVFLILIYALIFCMGMSIMPLLSQISMEYMSQGHNVSFGLARGLGSIAYAISAVVFTRLTSLFSPSLIGAVYVFFSILFLLMLKNTPAVYAVQADPAGSEQKSAGSSSIFSLAGKYPLFFVLVGGMCLCQACHTLLATYLIRLVEGHGGTQSMYGLAVFCMAASELPVLAIAPRLIKRFGTLPLAAAGAFFYIIRNCGTVLADSLPLMIASMMFQGLSFGLLTAVFTYQVSSQMKQEDQVMGQTAFALITNGLGCTLGNFGGGVLIDTFGLPALQFVIPAITLIGAGIMITAALFSKKISRGFSSFQHTSSHLAHSTHHA